MLNNRSLLRAFSLATLFISSLCLVNTAQADYDTGFAVNYVHGEGDLDGIKLAYQVNFDSLRAISEDLDLTLETSINFWEYDGHNDTDVLVAASPILRYPLFYTSLADVYLEGGIGVSFMKDTVFAGKDVGIHFQFEDRLGFAFRFGESRKNVISLTYLHYSNAGLSDHNPGIDLLNVGYSYRF